MKIHTLNHYSRKRASICRIGIFSLILWGILFAGVQCASTGPSRPLTEKERAIKVMPAAQDVSQQLSDKCKSIGKVESFNHMDNAKIRAGQVGANVIQNIYATNRNGLLQYDIRFWRCRP